MTSVWPALWPPWKRTTTSACSESQSTILPLPSSPHCDPTTTTLAMAALPHATSAPGADATKPGARPAGLCGDLADRRLRVNRPVLSFVERTLAEPRDVETMHVLQHLDEAAGGEVCRCLALLGSRLRGIARDARRMQVLRHPAEAGRPACAQVSEAALHLVGRGPKIACRLHVDEFRPQRQHQRAFDL